MKLVIALGGNALIKKGEKQTYYNLINNIKKTCKVLAPIIKKHKVVISFGNGPEIGYLALQNELAKKKIPPMPLDILGAESQGLIGYPLEAQLINSLRSHKRDVATILTQVLVDKNDPAFRDPTKFIGPFYTKLRADKLKNKYKLRKDADRGYRRVVPSPKPIKVLEAKTIQKLLKSTTIIAAGGGGIPVIEENGKLKGVEAVIDKDLASACLANSIKAEVLIMITSVPYAYLNYGTKQQKPIKKVHLDSLRDYYMQEHFPPGSMGPKIEAAINFLEKKGKKVIICSPENLQKALKGSSATIITK
ncbi:carbamate kinase [Candidatus Woesearchaeota archaeon]|nr:carbamate kinase [Candidatus Woesearchaeota archaeon]